MPSAGGSMHWIHAWLGPPMAGWCGTWRRIPTWTANARTRWTRACGDKRSCASRNGLFEVTGGIYQVRGMDLSNMTIVEGDTGVIVIDPLISAETAAAEHRAVPQGTAGTGR